MVFERETDLHRVWIVNKTVVTLKSAGLFQYPIGERWRTYNLNEWAKLATPINCPKGQVSCDRKDEIEGFQGLLTWTRAEIPMPGAFNRCKGCFWTSFSILGD